MELRLTGDDPLGALISGLDGIGRASLGPNGVRLDGLKSALPDLKALHKMVGLRALKRDIVDQIAYYAQGFNSRGKSEDYLHTVIYGPPGTGKTDVAKLLGSIFCKLGALPGSGFYKACRSDLVAGYLGQTAIKTRAVIDAALGGVLFIDEAYALGNSDKIDSFAKECIDTLCEALSVHRGSLMVVIAGYEEALEKCFFAYNPGLRSRFVWRYGTDKYSSEELGQMFAGKVKECGWELCMEDRRVASWFGRHANAFTGYGRDVDSLLTKTKIAHARRVFGSGDTCMHLTEEDLDAGLELFKRNKDRVGPPGPPLSMYS